MIILKVLLELIIYFRVIDAGRRYEYFALLKIHEEICMSRRNLSECENYYVERSARDAGTMPPNSLARHSRELQQVKDPCCGYCSCKDDCFEYGSCCLSEYTSLEHGRHIIESTRYKCVIPEYLTTTNTRIVKPVWLISKCLSEWHDVTEKELCENPGKDGSLESMVPVTQRYSVHCRNKHCAVCNGDDEVSARVSWLLEIGCQSTLSMSDNHLLTSLKDHKCNVVYQPPNNIQVKECEIIPFTISTCNVTGRWKYYDEMVVRVCQSFIDPFNLTYMNFFCYLCNVEEEWTDDTTICNIKPLEMRNDVTAPYSVVLSLNDIASMMQDTTLGCDASQFNDYKMMLCRDILCHGNRYLANEECVIDPTRTNIPCYSVYVKFTPANLDSRLYLETVQNSYFHQSIQNAFKEVIPNFYDAILKFDIYYKRSMLYTMKIADYVMVNIQLIPRSNKTDILNYIFNKLHTRTVEVYVTEVPLQLYCECVVHNAIQSDKSTSEMSNAGSEVLEIISEEYNSSCRHEESIFFRKVHVCPYVNITFTGLSMMIVEGRLYITETSREQIEFSSWEYELKGDYILICLTDYRSFYDKLNIQSSSTAKHVLLRSQTMVTCFCLSVLVYWFP